MATALPLTACALLAAGALVVRSDRARAWLLLAALGAAAAILVVHVADADQVQTLRDRPAVLAAAAAAGAALVAALAVLFARVPASLPVAVVATIPFRIPIAVGGSTANLLLPLYLVVAAGALAWALPRLRAPRDPLGAPGAGGDGEGEGDGDGRRGPGALEWVLGATLVLYAVQSAYTSDTDRALENLVFFYVPFAVLFALVSRIAWTRRVSGLALGVLTGLAVALAAIGYVEYATRHLFLNPKVIASNQLEDYFRVNSLFFDPNIYGRFLAVVLVLLVAWMLWRTVTREVALAGLVVAFLFGGLVLTLSQSSFAALLVGLAVLAALRWSAGRTLAVAGVLALVAVAAVALGTSAFDGGGRANDATSGRADLVEGGVGLFTDRPLGGWGSGSFAREYRRAEDVSAERAASASHTIPVTVAAEQGIGGLVLYLALLWLAFRRLFRGARRDVARAGVAAAFAVLVAHTMMYAAFLEDPLAWALLGVGTALAAAARPPDAAAETR
jgi:O-antigen ligase